MIKLVQRELLSCEAIVRRAPNGELLLIAQCGDVTEPAPGNRVYVWHSRDDGDSWSPRELLLPEDGRAVYQTEVSVIDGEVRVYVTFHNGKFCRNEHAVFVSRDSGYTWARGGELPLDGFYFVRGLLREGNNHYLPYQRYDFPPELSARLAREGKYLWDGDHKAVYGGVLRSRDNGKTYLPCEREAALPIGYRDGKLKFVWSEPAIARLPDGRLVMLLRFDYAGRLYRSFSSDDGASWSAPEPTEIPNPSNKVCLTSSGDGRIALFHTPDPVHGMAHRHPLEVWLSGDGMKSWEKKTLWDLDGWISYPDGFIENGVAYCSVELNRHDVYFIREKIF